jgi:vacuolar-type H+-ATPase subunit I/STV1
MRSVISSKVHIKTKNTSTADEEKLSAFSSVYPLLGFIYICIGYFIPVINESDFIHVFDPQLTFLSFLLWVLCLVGLGIVWSKIKVSKWERNRRK